MGAVQLQVQRFTFRPMRAGLPRPIAFLVHYGVSRETLVHAGEVAERIGVSPDAVLLAEGWVDEDFFFRALADWLGVPFHVGPAPLNCGVAADRSIRLGIVYLAPLAPYRAIVAPRGAALRLLIEADEETGPISALAITSPRRLAAMVRVTRGQEIAARAAGALERVDPALSAHGEMRFSQTVAAASFGLTLVALGFGAPIVERAITSGLLWTLFTATIGLRFACAVAAEAPSPPPPRDEADLPVYTVLVAMYREGEVIPKLVAGLDRLDYPGIM